MAYDDIEKLFYNLDEAQRYVVANFAAKLAVISSDKWSGEMSFKIQFNQGGIAGGMKINRSETVQFPKKRRVRSRGL